MAECPTAVDVVSAYPFHMYAQAAQLARRGRLRRLHTTYPARYVADLDASHVHSRARWAAVRRVAGRLGERVDAALNRRVIADFDAWAAPGVDGADCVIGLSSFATATLRRARRNGALTVCDRGSTHILTQRAILERERDRWDLPIPRFDSWIVERELDDYQNAELIFVPSAPALASFVERGVPQHKLHKVPYGVDLGAFSPPSEPPPWGRVISIGPVSLQKGHQYLVPAYEQVRRPGTRLQLLGRPDEDFVRRIARDTQDIELNGPVARHEVADHLRRASIFVLASVQEGLALVVLQAMASGLPVVVSEATGAAEYVTDGVEGFVVPTADQDALAQALGRLLDDPERAAEMGRAARRRVEHIGGWEAYGDAVVAALTNEVSVC